MGQGRLRPHRRAHCDQVKTKGAPQRVVGRSPTAFSRHGQNDRGAGVLPMPVLPISHPMDEVHGLFYSFCRGSRALPMLSFFTYVVHAVSENHFKLRTWAVTNSFNCPGHRKAMGAPPPNPHENNKDSNPPRCARSANNGEGRMGAIRPHPPTRNNVPGPCQFGSLHVGHDTTWAVTAFQIRTRSQAGSRIPALPGLMFGPVPCCGGGSDQNAG